MRVFTECVGVIITASVFGIRTEDINVLLFLFFKCHVSFAGDAWPVTTRQTPATVGERPTATTRYTRRGLLTLT